MDKFVVKTGKIFQAGDYPDKKLNVDLSKLKKIAARFTGPVPLDLNHKSSGLKRLDSKLGNLNKVWYDDKGQLFGSVEIPTWLNEAVCKDDDGNDLPLPVSCALGKDEEGFLITKLALTDTPRVSDAAVFAAFSKAHPEEVSELADSKPEIIGDEPKFSSELIKELIEFAKKSEKTSEGQSVIQSVHDTLARAGAICYETADFHSKAELSSIQKAHDEMMAAGATCRLLKEGEKPLMWFSSEMSEQPTDDKSKGDTMDSEKLSLVQNILKFIGSDGSAAAPATEETSKKTEFIAGKVVKAEDVKAETKEFSSAEVEALRRELDDEKKRVAKLINDGIAAQSKILANEVINGKHAQENERAGLELAFSLALTDDQNNPVEVQFSADSKGGRVDALKALYATKTIVPLTEELVDEKKTETLLSDDKAGQEDATKKRLDAVRERAMRLAEKQNARRHAAK